MSIRLEQYYSQIIIIIIILRSVANVPKGLKYRKISVSEWLGVVVRNCLL